MGLESKPEKREMLTGTQLLETLGKGEVVTGFPRLSDEDIKRIDEELLMSADKEQCFGSIYTNDEEGIKSDIPQNLNSDTVMYIYQWLDNPSPDLAMVVQEHFLDARLGKSPDEVPDYIEYKEAA